VSRTPPDPVTLPAPEAVRAHARKLIRRTGRAYRRLGDGDDPEALHDFRVGLRRLRTLLRAYRPFQAAGRKAERRLKDLAGRTNRARDVEVALAWLDARREGLAPHEGVGAARLAARLAAERDRDGNGDGPEAAAGWSALSRDLTQRLARDPDGAQPPPPFAATAAACLREHAGRLREQLAEVREIADQEAAHRARIAAKRLRYLLEPLAGSVDGVNAATRALASLQDTLGTLHDLEVLIGHLGDALREAAAEGADRRLAAVVTGGHAGSGTPEAADPEVGLLSLAARAGREQAERFKELGDGYLSDGGGRLLAPVEKICAALDARAGG